MKRLRLSILIVSIFGLFLYSCTGTNIHSSSRSYPSFQQQRYYNNSNPVYPYYYGPPAIHYDPGLHYNDHVWTNGHHQDVGHHDRHHWGH